ncbi:MBL fold metallo-hydrolase [Neptunicella marina]|uniref:MBL fold metallo-hydrolase n=1 Tax=Neptunicella marina TaxID=2125989 RepID=A0A8J6IU41_9ALTE|nr:MBL fold metallo-hydrolase [Neptunicella marina]MBC3766364.1 MBL fold metallo-hydrolase [Neptunicella marina]
MKILTAIFVTVLVLAVGGFIVNQSLSATEMAQGQQSSHYHNGRFENDQPIQANTFKTFLKVMARYFTADKTDHEPDVVLPINTLTREQLEALSDDSFHLVKLGHSSVLLKVYGEYWLLDPVFSKRASPFSFMGPKRFHPTPISIDELPPIDKVLISHNHYDHLDKQSIKQLVGKTRQFLVPMGVEGDLRKWGVAEDDIISFDWWQDITTKNALIAFTPSRHFSGRSFSDGNKTLWGSWVIKTGHESVYFSGDSGYFEGFKKIGQKYGPFDLTLIETGAYDNMWPDVHMLPEQSVQAHIDLQGKTMIPVHNGTFNLALHTWYEPLERVTQLAAQHDIAISTPVVGDIMQIENLVKTEHWWQAYMPD